MPDGASFAFAAAPDPEELADFDRNDWGNACRLIRLAGGVHRGEGEGDWDLTACRLLYLRERGWIGFNGRVWDLRGGQREAERLAAQVAQGLWAQGRIWVARIEGKADPGDKPTQTVAKIWEFVQGCGNAGRIAAMLKVAESYLEVELETFDRDPLALCVANGTLKFRRGLDGEAPAAQFRGFHNPADRITRMCAAAWRPDAPRPLFDQVMADALPAEADRRFLQAALGYAATGSVQEQVFLVLQGLGGDGKSTIINAAREALGTYAATANIATFLDTGPKRGGDASPDVAELAGDTRMISTGEPPSGAKLDTGAIKQWTGGAPVKARALNKGLFEFNPRGKVVIECNRRPQINDTDEGIWRRLKILMFRHQVEKPDKTLPGRITAGELDGVLQWLADGLLIWLAEGLPEPESVTAAIEDYRRGSNPAAQWLAQCVEKDPQALTLASEFYSSYKEFIKEAYPDDKPMSQRSFGAMLGDQQIILAGKDSAGKVRRRGAKVRPAWGSGWAPAADGAEPATGDGFPEGYDGGEPVW